VNFRKYLVLAGVTVFAAAGDSMLSHGMKQIGGISLDHLQGVIFAILNPWVAIGILLLLGFFATYMTALSWADLTYVLPATSLGYVLLALVAKFVLHEQVSTLRWLGIAFITGGVGFIAGGPALTEHSKAAELAGGEPSEAASLPFDSAQNTPLAKDARNHAARGVGL
jgi:drug/metabolite transporter (DMT)-like permease